MPSLMPSIKKILITGSDGLLAQHARALLFAKNAEAKFHGSPEPFEILLANKDAFNSEEQLLTLLGGVDAVFHFAGVNRASENEIESANQTIATHLIGCLDKLNIAPHVLYANSTHSTGGSSYGKGKQGASDILQAWAKKANAKYTDIVFPHIFGEGGKPFYNTVTATLCQQIVKDEQCQVNPEGQVELLHAGSAAEIMLQCVNSKTVGVHRPEGKSMSIVDLHATLLSFYENYKAGVLANFDDPFDASLFNTLRYFMFPSYYPHELTLHKDERGVLFEAVKGGGAGQTFLSWTEPGVTRGNHFHRNKIERFLVVKGEAVIRVRHVFESKVYEFIVSGDKPTYVDIPTLHTHSIVNKGTSQLLTMFWAHEIFDPKNPDTYAIEV